MSAKHPESGFLTRARRGNAFAYVNAAADLIYEHGVDRTSLDEVMAASGVSKFRTSITTLRTRTRWSSKLSLFRPSAFLPPRAAASWRAAFSACPRGVGAGDYPARMSRFTWEVSPPGSLANELANTSESA